MREMKQFDEKSKSLLVSSGVCSYSLNELIAYDSDGSDYCRSVLLVCKPDVNGFSSFPDYMKRVLKTWYDGLDLKGQLLHAIESAQDILTISKLKSKYLAFENQCLSFVSDVPASLFLLAFEFYSPGLEKPQKVKVVSPLDCTPSAVKIKSHEVVGIDLANKPKTRFDYYPELKVEGKVPYVSGRGLNAKNGQRKLFVAFSRFVLYLRSCGVDSPRICCFGAAPGIGVVLAANALGLRLIMVDDYPMSYDERHQYVTFHQFLETSFLENNQFDAVFYDFFDPNYDNEWNYNFMIATIARIRLRFPIHYNLKRFVSFGSAIRVFKSSKFIPMAYSTRGTSEFREQGSLEESTDRVMKSGLEDAMRNFTQNKRVVLAPHMLHLTCNCWCCATAERVAIDLFKYDKSSRINFLKRLSSLGFSKKVSNIAKVLESEFVPIPLDEYGMVMHDGYAWDSNVFADGFKGGVLTMRKSQGYARYYRRPVKAIVQSANSKYVYVLPRVNVLALEYPDKLDEIWFSPVGCGKSYGKEDVNRLFSCPSCEAPVVKNSIPTRQYLASFLPSRYSCYSCHASFSISYKPFFEEE